LVKIQRKKMVTRRIEQLKEKVKIDTQKLRRKTLQGLEELFNMAEKMAKTNNLKLKQRQMWTRVAAYIAQIINSVASGFDEKQIDEDLNKLEKLINEATAKNKTQKTGTKTN